MGTSWDTLEKSGAGFLYDEENLMYDQELDEDSGNPVLYDSFGLEATLNTLTKSTT